MDNEAWRDLTIGQLKDIQQTLGRWIDRVSQERGADAAERLREFLEGLNEVTGRIKDLDGRL
jgi:hypothetical protein